MSQPSFFKMSQISLRYLLEICVCYVILTCSVIYADSDDPQSNQRFKIEGKVSIPHPSSADQEWLSNTRILIDGGSYLGFLKSDGTFRVSNIPSGSYVVEVVNPMYYFEPVRVDITSKGKTRTRRLNNLKPGQVQQLNYPLRLKAKGRTSYFQLREQWRITDILFNPMIMMMVLPFLMIMVLPKLINTQDPETQKEMQNQMNIFNPKSNMPDISEMVTNWLGGGGGTKKTGKAKPSKRRS